LCLPRESTPSFPLRNQRFLLFPSPGVGADPLIARNLPIERTAPSSFFDLPARSQAPLLSPPSGEEEVVHSLSHQAFAPLFPFQSPGNEGAAAPPLSFPWGRTRRGFSFPFSSARPRAPLLDSFACASRYRTISPLFTMRQQLFPPFLPQEEDAISVFPSAGRDPFLPV